MYLEFISAVTEDILSREYISDRFFIFLPPNIFYEVLKLKLDHRHFFIL